MALIDRIKYDGPPEILVWKYQRGGGQGDTDNLVLGAQLIVNESQEAIFFKGGQALDVFGPGTHTLSTKNMPLLQKLVNLPFGGQTPFTAEVFYVNKTSRLDYKWGTKTPMPIEDPKYNILLNVGCFGQYGLRIDDSRTFVTQIVGTMQEWDGDRVLEYFKGVVLTRVKETIARYLVEKNISISTVTAYVDELSKLAEERIRPEFGKYGLALLNFFISSINIPQEELREIQKAQQERFKIDALGAEKYQMKRAYDVMEGAANNQGTIGGLMGAGIGLGVGAQMAAGPIAQMARQTMQPAAPQPAAPPSQAPTGAAEDPMAKLGKLKQLLDGGLITQQDFDKKKAEILAAL